MQFLVSVAWRNLWRHRWRSLLTASAMAVGVAMCMASMCFQDGMFAQIFNVMVEQRLGHVQVHHPEYPATRVLHETLPEARDLVGQVDALAGTEVVSPKLNGFALVGGEKKSAGAMLVGIEPARTKSVANLDERVVEGRYLSDDAASEVIVGHKLFEDLEIALGDAVVVVTQAADGSLGNVLYDVVGVFKTGDAQMDRAGAYVHLADLQQLLVLPDQVHQITLLTDDPDRIEGYADTVRDEIGADTVEVEPWWVASPQTAQLMDLRDAGALIVLGIVFGAAAFGVLNTMMMSVFERTQELGVLRALGLKGGRLVALVMVESAFLALVACGIGLVLGGALDWYIVTYGFDMSGAAEDGFSFNGVMLDPVIHGEVRVDSIVLVLVAVLVVSIAASVWPAWRAASLRPVEAIRAE